MDVIVSVAAAPPPVNVTGKVAVVVRSPLVKAEVNVEVVGSAPETVAVKVPVAVKSPWTNIEVIVDVVVTTPKP